MGSLLGSVQEGPRRVYHYSVKACTKFFKTIELLGIFYRFFLKRDLVPKVYKKDFTGVIAPWRSLLPCFLCLAFISPTNDHGWRYVFE